MVTAATSPFRRVFANDFSALLEDHPAIPVGSSLSVMGALLVIVRERFFREPDSSIVWTWQNDSSKPGLYVEDHKRSNITIEAALQADNEVKEKKPAILIGRGPIQGQKLVLDDKVVEDRKTGARMHHNLVHGAYNFSCRATDKGTPEILGNIIFEWLMYCNDVFRKFFQFHEVGPFSLGTVTPVQKASDVWECVVECRLSWEHRWSVTPLAPKLTGIIARLYADDSVPFVPEITDSSELIATIASSSLNRTS